MFDTDLQGFCKNLKNNQMFHLLILLCICIVLYMMLSKYMNKMNNMSNFTNVSGDNGNYCKGDIPKMDEAIIRNMINNPNRNPAMLTSSMVVPEPSKPNDETRRKTKMDILNMFYSSFDDDLTTIKARPQNLYIIP